MADYHNTPQHDYESAWRIWSEMTAEEQASDACISDAALVWFEGMPEGRRIHLVTNGVPDGPPDLAWEVNLPEKIVGFVTLILVELSVLGWLVSR